jgi:hypothetical protein
VHKIHGVYAFGAVCTLQSVVVVTVPFFGYLGDLYKRASPSPPCFPHPWSVPLSSLVSTSMD